MMTQILGYWTLNWLLHVVIDLLMREAKVKENEM